MLLKSLSISNFRCHSDLQEIPIHRLTVFIGENDAGKTGLLDAIDFLLTNKKPSPSDFRMLDNKDRAKEIIITGVFEIEDQDSIPEEFTSLDGKTLTLIKTFRTNSDKTEVLGKGFFDERFNSFDKQNADSQKELLKSIGLTPAGNGQDRNMQFMSAIRDGKLKRDEKAKLEVKFNQISQYLPHYESISSADYKNPDSLITRTLHSVVSDTLKPKNAETGLNELIPQLSEVEKILNDALESKISEVEENLTMAHDRLQSVNIEPQIDFTKSCTTFSLIIDTGDGAQAISSFGEGTKRKIWMGLLDWERKVQEEANISVFRVYDEPDVNLDYAAERKLFANILDATGNPKSKTQAIVSTHAVTLVDRAPTKSINLIKINADKSREIEYFKSEDDEDISSFLSTVGRSVGISNSALFYEKAFIVVEGESEERALPIIYRHLHQHSLIEDGISLINLRTCSAWKAILSFLSHHRADNTVMLLDNDCTEPESSGHINPEVLNELGFPKNFSKNNCFYIGKKEFEDSFETTDIINILNNQFPREDGRDWMNSDIDKFRNSSCKFGSDLIKEIKTNCIKTQRSSVQKPSFAEKLAVQSCQSNLIPKKILDVFKEVREKINL